MPPEPLVLKNRRWRDALTAGLLCGLAFAATEVLIEPTADMPWSTLAGFALFLLCSLGASGVAWALFGIAVAGRGRTAIAAAIALTGPAGASLYAPIAWVTGHLPIGDDVRALTAVDGGHFAHVFWINAVYGGLYISGYVASQRSLHMRRTLLRIGAARSQASKAFAEQRLDEHRGQVPPGVLLDALAALKRDYVRAPVRAEHILDRLVAFLRAAMPGVRSGRSTLGAELSTIAAYLDLRRAMTVGATWQVAFDPPPPDLIFPALWLLPAIESINATGAGSASLRARRHGDEFIVTIEAEIQSPARWLSPALEQRLRIGLRTGFGGRARALFAGPGDDGGETQSMEIILPVEVAKASRELETLEEPL